jgi:signal transduction histidine kinase
VSLTPDHQPAAPDSDDLQAVLDLVVVSAVELLHGSAGAIALWDEAASRFVLRASYGLGAEALASLHPRLDRAILGILGRAGGMVSVLRVEPVGQWTPRFGLEHILALPLRAADRLLGVIYVLRPASAAAFGAADVRVLDLFARQAAGALERSAALAEALAEKTRLETLQNAFLSTVSHELQTPVSIIKAYAETLSREDATWPPETVRRVAATIQEECDRLHGLITDLLDLSRIQAGRLAMRIAPVDLARLAREVVDLLQQKTGIHQLQALFPADFPKIEGDEEKLRRVLRNLVDNAIKYAPGGGPIIVAGEARPDEVRLVVRDEGVGIPPEELGRVFERFYRVDSRLSRSTHGAGLGLSICKAIVEAHGGRIWAESAGPGKGSTFTVALPRP